MRWWLYQILFAVVYIAMLPSFLLRMRRRGGYREHFLQRFGYYSPEIRQALRERPRIWVHAVSVGEAFVAGRLIEELRERKPDIALIISTTSSTGYGVCKTLVGPDDVLIYFPVDFPGMVRRALNAANPLALVLTESEFWPNMIRQCRRRNIPLILANGRVSDRSFPRYLALRYYFKPVLRAFSALLVQFERDRERLVDMGAEPGAVFVAGTVKFDVSEPPADRMAKVREGLLLAGIDEGDTILLGASTWPGEETTLVEAYRELRRGYPRLRLVIVPRHMERGDEVEAEILRLGLPCLRRSKITQAGDSVSEAGSRDAVLLADTTGELFAFCAVADLVFVGKTLPPNIGGQNMIEPAALGKPVVVGPHTENFAGVMDILRGADAVREVGKAGELEPLLRSWLENPEPAKAQGARAAAAIEAQAGAPGRSAERILRIVFDTAEHVSRRQHGSGV